MIRPVSRACMNADTARAELADRFRLLRLVIPDPEPFALHWLAEGGCITVPVDQAEEDDLILTTEDLLEYGRLTVEDLADQALCIVLEAQKKYPRRWSWRRWRLTRRVAILLYASGITRSGGGFTHSGRDPHRVVYHLPRWGDVLPRRGGQLRPYVLWKPDWWWECHLRQGWRLRGRHRPLAPYAGHTGGVCAACLPCPDCGAPYECRCGEDR